MIKLVKRAVGYNRRHGFRSTIVRILIGLLREQDAIHKAKQKVLNALLLQHKSVVAYGPFKGMKLSRNVWWGQFDLITKILGVYEEHVLKKLFKISKKVDVPFIDIGAADGYFAVGMAFGGYFNKVYAYEISLKGRERLLENIQANNSEDRVFIKEEANYKSLEQLISLHKGAVILVDIEGDEYDLLNADLLRLLRNCYVICELHPWLVDQGIEKEELLIEEAQRIFDISLMQRDSYSPNCFTELYDFTDEERLVAFGEGREKNMRWLILEPKNWAELKGTC
jgi:hypothetical protein